MAVDTFAIATGADDGWWYRSDAAYATVSAGSGSSNTGDSSSNPLYATRETGYYITVACVRWDTSSLPDTNIVSAATLDIHVAAVGTADGLSLIGEWYDAGAAVNNSDWTTLPSGNALPATLISGLAVGSVNSLALSNVAANVNKTGYTGIRLGITQRASDAAPTGYNAVEIASYEHASYQEPRLVVTHSAPVTRKPGLTLLGAG